MSMQGTHTEQVQDVPVHIQLTLRQSQLASVCIASVLVAKEGVFQFRHDFALGTVIGK